MIGITGQIGAGKSFVGELLRKRNFCVMDADFSVHQLYCQNAELRESIAREFGPEALTESGVNRKFFAELIFKESAARVRLESLVYPVLTEYVIRKSPDFVEAALFENVPEIVESLEEIWVVRAPFDVRLLRLVNQRNFSREDALRRMELQKNKETRESWRLLFPRKKLRFIENNGNSPPELPSPFDC